MTAILEIRSLTRCFQKITAVDTLNLSVEPGEVFGLLGSNGAGKSTTIKMLTTLLPPSSGHATVDGFDIIRQPVEVRRRIGYVPQVLSADATLTGYENLLLFAKLYGISRSQQESRVRNVLDFMGLQDVADKLVRQYSGGTIRRLEIAQSILHQPRVLFLDEPTLGLDPLARHTVWKLLNHLRKEYGTTIFFTTHLMEEAEQMCDRVAIMHQGKVIAIGTPIELKTSIGRSSATLDDVFVQYTGKNLESSGSYREISRTRLTARRLA